MSFRIQETAGPFVPTDFIMPEEWEEATLVLSDYLKSMAYAINAREIGQYQQFNVVSSENISETPTGQQWYTDGEASVFRYPLRTVVTFALQDYSGALTTQTVAHGISTTATTRITRIYGMANDPGASSLTQAIPLPYIDVDALTGGVEVWIDATNVNLRYQVDYSAFTDAHLVIEYVQS